MPTPAAVLTVAGADSAGGAGVHADLRTFSAFGLHGASAIAALTAQNTRGIDAVEVIPADFVAAQVRSVTDDLTIAAAKTGFLASPDTVEAMGELAAAGRLPRLVVDPVLVRATGDRLFDRAVERAYTASLLPHAIVATPNRAEAALLVGRPLRTVDDMVEAAVELAAAGPGVVVVKGGEDEASGSADTPAAAVDVVADASGELDRLEMPLVATGNDHGSGCSFAAAVVAGLARGATPLDAIRDAKAYVHAGLVAAADWQLGSGHGPIDAFARIEGFVWHARTGGSPNGPNP